MDVLARGNEWLERLEEWEPFRRRYREQNVRTLPPRDPWANLDDDIRHGLYYGLAGEPIGLRTWTQLWEDTHHHIQAADEVETDAGKVLVSTIWLGIDHGWRLGGPPIIFETMTFGRESETYDGAQWRYATLQEALAGHRDIHDELAQSWWLNLGGRV